MKFESATAGPDDWVEVRYRRHCRSVSNTMTMLVDSVKELRNQIDDLRRAGMAVEEANATLHRELEVSKARVSELESRLDATQAALGTAPRGTEVSLVAPAGR